ncbi:MAG: cyclic nucleotide-binding domain-containing protein [Bacteroidota bacterium]
MKKVLFLLGHLNDRDVEWLIDNGHKETIKPGDILIHRNEPIQNLYIVLSGQLSVTDGVANMRELAKVGPGEVVGEMSFLESRLPAVNVLATETSELYAIDRTLIEDRIQKDLQFRANFYYALALFLSNRLRKTTSQLGFGSPEEEDLVDANILDGVAQGGSRFSQILKKFSEI